MGHFLCLLVSFYVDEGLYLSGFECLLFYVVLVFGSVLYLDVNCLDPRGLGFSSARTEVKYITLVMTELRML